MHGLEVLTFLLVEKVFDDLDGSFGISKPGNRCHGNGKEKKGELHGEYQCLRNGTDIRKVSKEDTPKMIGLTHRKDCTTFYILPFPTYISTKQPEKWSQRTSMLE